MGGWGGSNLVLRTTGEDQPNHAKPQRQRLSSSLRSPPNPQSQRTAKKHDRRRKKTVASIPQNI